MIDRGPTAVQAWMTRRYARRNPNASDLRSVRAGRDSLEFRLRREQRKVRFGQRLRFEGASRLGGGDDLVLVQPDAAHAKGTLEIFGHRLVAVAQPLVATLGLYRPGQLRKPGLECVARARPHVTDLPLSPPAETEVGDVEELLVVDCEGEIGRGG